MDLTLKNVWIIFLFSLSTWMCSNLLIWVSLQFTTIEMALVYQLLLTPIFTAIPSFFYYAYFNQTKPIITAFLYTICILGLNFLIIALMVEKNISIFTNPFGTWLPLLFVFITCFLTGYIMNKIY